jgi:uncharacterized protein YdhG (YjbR/CyaY superfamily)
MRRRLARIFPVAKPIKLMDDALVVRSVNRMKKQKPANRSSSAKTKSALKPGTPRDIDEYLARVPEPARSTLQKVRNILRATAPKEAVECISYQMPMYKYKGLLFGFAAFKDHCSLFAATGSLVEQFASELKPYKTAKGTIQFSSNKPFPGALLKKLVKARVAQKDAKQKR